MDAGVLGHIAHNLTLIGVYILLGTVYLPGFVRRLDIPQRIRKFFTVSSFVFFVFCAWTHFELLIHLSELPEDFFTASHNIFGFLQAAGALGFAAIIHSLVFNFGAGRDRRQQDES